MNRRDFLKIVGITTATSTAALYGCGSKEGSSEGSKVLGPIPTDKMTYRSFPGLGSDKVSILGYGCMRWPTVPAPDGKGEMIDQDAVNELVDYAIAHGVNYFDTSPMYVQGWSEIPDYLMPFSSSILKSSLSIPTSSSVRASLWSFR